MSEYTNNTRHSKERHEFEAVTMNAPMYVNDNHEALPSLRQQHQ